MPCDRNWLKPLFTALQNSLKLYETNDYSYFLPIPRSSSHPKLLNYITILLHIVLLIIAIFDLLYINIFATNYLFPLWTLSFYNELNIFIMTLLIYVVIMFAVHVSIMAPFLIPPSKLKYTDKTYWGIIIKSLLTKSIIFPILFSISPLLLLYMLLFIFIFGNSPITYFKPNLRAFHDFHLHLNNEILPSLIARFIGYKSSEWVYKFIYLLFNCAILDEYIMKKTCPNIKTRVSFVNLLAGNDVDKVLKRVSVELENMINLYHQYGNLNTNILKLNSCSWNKAKNLLINPKKDNPTNYNFQYLGCVLFPFHILLFWIYYIFNNNNNFETDSIDIIIIGISQFIFYIFSLILIYIHIKHTVQCKPQLLYIWSNYNLMDFYCSFHDDDEIDSFKTKLDSYIDLFATEYVTSTIIRKTMRFNEDQQWFADTLIAFCCIMDDKQYEQHSYNAIMSIISRTMRVEHIKQSSSKQSILRNSMHLHFGIDLNEFVEHQVATNDDNDNDNVLLRKWSNDSNHSNGPSSFKQHSYKNSAFSSSPLHEEKEQNDGYQHVDNSFNEESNTMVFVMGEQQKFHKMDEIHEEDEPSQNNHDDDDEDDDEDEEEEEEEEDESDRIRTGNYKHLRNVDKPSSSEVSEDDNKSHINIAITPVDDENLI